MTVRPEEDLLFGCANVVVVDVNSVASSIETHKPRPERLAARIVQIVLCLCKSLSNDLVFMHINDSRRQPNPKIDDAIVLLRQVRKWRTFVVCGVVSCNLVKTITHFSQPYFMSAAL